MSVGSSDVCSADLSITDEMSWMMRRRSLFDSTCLEYAYEIAKLIHASRNTMLRTRSVNVFGMKNAGKSTLVRGIWHVDAAAGAAASTKLDVFNPIPDRKSVV